MSEAKCMYCDHSRRRHGREGCTHIRKNGKRCSCSEPFMNKDSFTADMGDPKDD